MICLCSETVCCYDSQSNKVKFSSKGLNERTLEDCGDDHLCKYHNLLEKVVNETSTNRSFCTKQQDVLAYGETKKELSQFYPKKVISRTPNTLGSLISKYSKFSVKFQCF